MLVFSKFSDRWFSIRRNVGTVWFRTSNMEVCYGPERLNEHKPLDLAWRSVHSDLGFLASDTRAVVAELDHYGNCSGSNWRRISRRSGGSGEGWRRAAHRGDRRFWRVSFRWGSTRELRNS